MIGDGGADGVLNAAWSTPWVHEDGSLQESKPSKPRGLVRCEQL